MCWYLHACPACHGDMYEEPDRPGVAICLMCGRSAEVRRPTRSVLEGTRLLRAQEPVLEPVAISNAA
ncbi:MAG: hypothetical protein HY534_03710 [Chloroflexi bacterium]|nr:hypothetical protein [Chloroflexota bacterium]